MSFKTLVGLGVVVHVILLLSIFDIYFTSPIINGIPAVPNTLPPISKRVVVISVDGLRYDALMEDDSNGLPIASYMRTLMTRKSSWGVSNTHLPTESRPGHVAMLAGFYEDPSAVTKGWKENPVDFDSIFNRSLCSFAWGSPDIVNIFYKDLKHSCSYKYTYENNQDFAGDTWEQDNWVLTQIIDFFKSSGNPKKYSQDGSLFFLHLMGQDTSGHTHKPKTDLYRFNLRNVDRIVKEVEDLFEKIFMDNSTSYILTADHGMTDWGSHGAGDPQETLTPIIAWGKGIKIDKINKLEIEQADITPLLAALLGVPIPVNSVGVLPSQFLNVSQARIVQFNLLNSQQISSQYFAIRAQIESKSSFIQYKSFPSFDHAHVTAKIADVEHDIKNGLFTQAADKNREILRLSFAGLQFYQKYYQTPLFVLMTISYIGWIFYLVCQLSEVQSPGVSVLTCLSLLPMSICMCYVIHTEKFPVTYHAYVLLPTFLLAHLLQLILSKKISEFMRLYNLLSVGLLLVGIELFVIGFFYRWIWSIILMALVIWPLFGKRKTSSDILFVIWTASGVCLAMFTLMDVVGKQPAPLLNLIASIALSAITGYYAHTRDGGVVKYAPTLLTLLAGLNSYLVHTEFQTRGGLSYINQSISWALLLLSMHFLTRHDTIVLKNLINSFTSLTTPFVLLSISHEGLFLLCLLTHLSCWVCVEMDAADVVAGSIRYQEYTRPRLHGDKFAKPDARRAYFFLAYIFIALFGVGNLATLNSYDPAWVRCFITTFSPYAMIALILLKAVIPFFAVCLAFRVLTLMLNITPYKTFVAVLIFSNVMGLNFLFLVRNEGSWLDIGTSLSHYVIQQVMVVFLLLLYLASLFVIRDPIPRRDKVF